MLALPSLLVSILGIAVAGHGTERAVDLIPLDRATYEKGW